MAEHESILQEFMVVTGIEDESRAKFYLEAANWELSLALSGYFEGGGDEDIPVLMDAESTPPPVLPSASAGPASHTAKPPASASAGPRRFGTLSDIQSGSKPETGEESGSDDDEEKQAFYAGGAGAHGGSGQQVLGPSGKKKDPNKMIEELFKAAKEAGAEEVEPGATDRPRGGGGGSAFQGQGFRLGQTDSDHELVGTPMPTAGRQSSPVEDIEVTLKMWKEGFSVDDGPLRAYDDPDNRDFLKSIQRGEIPNELVRLAKGGEVGLNMEDHRSENFVQPKRKFKAFGGGGQRLGSDSPIVIVAGPTDAVASTVAKAVASGVPPTSAPVAAAGEAVVQVDETEPTTTLQIRLGDGTRLVGRFNHTHVVRDIRTFIVGSRPQYAAANFILMTTFPNQELDDETKTLTEANLLNAVIVQRVK